MGTIINKIIRIESISNTDGRYTIKDHENQTFSFFEKKADKTTSQAYEHFMNNNHNEAFKKGDTARIGYSESTAPSRDGKSTITYKNIISMFPSNEEPGTSKQSRPLPKQPQDESEKSLEPREFETKSQYGMRLAIHGMVNGLLASGESPQQVINSLDELFRLETQIEKRLQTGPQAEVEVVDSKEINVENIPF